MPPQQASTHQDPSNTSSDPQTPEYTLSDLLRIGLEKYTTFRCERLDSHNFAYKRIQYDGVVVTEKCCMACGETKLIDPIPVSK